MPKTSEAMLKAINKYQKEKVDELKIRVPKGRKEELQTHAAAHNESLNGFVNRAIDNEIERDNEKADG